MHELYMYCLQSKLESIQFKLRIPQRKPWGAINEDATSAAITMGQTDKVRPDHCDGLIKGVGASLVSENWAHSACRGTVALAAPQC